MVMPSNSPNIEHQIYTMCMIQRNNEILLLKRPNHRGFPGYIAPGGKVDFPESIVQAAIREVKEELGLQIDVRDVVKMGMTSCSIVSENMIDNEFCHVYIYPFEHDWNSFALQYEEVSGVVRARLNEAEAFFLGETTTLNIEGYEYFPDGQRVKIVRPVGTAQFVPYRELYVAHVIKFAREKIFNQTS